ncbi:MAG: hypothetical protein ACRDM7_14325 [Thermoleophilaceae bacterium]
MKASGEVAKRASRNVINKELELGLRYNPMLGDDLQQAKVESGQRGDPIGPCLSSAPRANPSGNRFHQTDHIRG